MYTMGCLLRGVGWLLLLFSVAAITPCLAWTDEELDLFDLVEEIGIGENFYDLMDISQVT